MPEKPAGKTRRRCLVVDDDEVIRRLLRNCLGEAEFEIVEAADAEAAIARLREGSFDIVISDCHMPGGGGPAVYDEVRNSKNHRNTIFLLMSGSISRPGDLRENLKPDGFLLKPFGPEGLKKEIELAERTRADA